MTSPQNLVKNVICPDALLGQRLVGASKGLGQAIAQLLASSGAVVHGLSRDEATLSAAMQDLPERVIEPLGRLRPQRALGSVVGDACYDILIHNTGGRPG